LKAWLVINEFLYTHKFQELNQWFLEAANKRGVELEVKSNAKLLFCLGQDTIKIEEIDFVLFWDKDIRLAKTLENRGLRLFNSASAIEICDDKALTHLALENHKIPMPKTLIAPMTYENIGYTNINFVKKVEHLIGMPIIIKECFGSFGQQVYFMENHDELVSKVKELERTPLLFQEFIASSFARDIRLQVVGKKVVASMYRYSENGDFRANITNGGKMKKYTPTKNQIELALKVCEIIGLDFAGVDLLFDEKENPILCEVNSNAHFKNIFDCTGVNVADYIMDYILNVL
jgi:RimK family alpha-L-glutamate ligase